MPGEPIYLRRRDKLLWGTVAFIAGLLATAYSAAAARIFFAIAIGSVISAIVRGNERIQ